MMKSRSAYVWRRDLSAQQMRKIDGIGHLRRRIMPAQLAEDCAFARCQLRLPRDWYNVYAATEGKWKGKRVTLDFQIRPLFVDYAVAVYQRVIADALAYYPSFTRYEVVDGPLAGERRLVFPDKLDEAAAYWMQTRAWWVMEHTDVAVAETCRVTRDETDRGPVTVHLSLDRPQVNENTQDEVAAVMAKGRTFPIDSKPRTCDPKLALDLFVELSLPELVLLNWPLVRKPPSDADRQLHAAIDSFDLEGVRAALAAGADPNTTLDEDFADVPLTRVCEFEHWHRHTRGQSDWRHLPKAYPGPDAIEKIRMIDTLVEAGAAVDWAPPNELTPLAEATLSADAAVVRHLLDLGADPSIRCHDDETESAWGTAWEFADYRCNPHVDNDDRSAWEALTSRWPEPFGGFGEGKQNS